MAQVFEIPLTPGTPQLLRITIVNVVYNLSLKWCDPAQAWTLDILDVNSNPIVTGLQLVTGADLLEQLTYLVIGGQLVAQTDNQPYTVPTFQNLGVTGHLYFVPNVKQ
jgi:hypothetical protein